MTLGQRIAQKRKELGLSQEGLGEQLGVSRQAIYKWESDASLPEIEKLITLSKIFSVSVGWLLGVEEAASETVSQDQEKLVEEVLSRYQAAQPKPQKSVWDQWAVRVLFVLCGIMVALLVGNHQKMKEMDQQYANLANSIGEVNYSVDRQISSITRRVEDILKSQNELTAEWSAALASTDLRANTAAFDLRAVPRTYVEGMTAIFQARSGEDTVVLPVEPGEDHAFAGRIICPLTDDISLSVIFVTGDKRETQRLEDYYSLYTDTFPALRVDGDIWPQVVFADTEQVTLSASERYSAVTVRNIDQTGGEYRGWNPDPPAALQVGLFRDRKLVMWYEGRPETIHVNGKPVEGYGWFRTREVTLESGHEYCEAAVYTDELGRQMIYDEIPVLYDGGKSGWTMPSVHISGDLADWEF